MADEHPLSDANGMWPSVGLRQPSDAEGELPVLSEFEEMLIARVIPIMSVYKKDSGHSGLKGHMCSFFQDVATPFLVLPRNVANLPVFLAVKPGQKQGDMDFIPWIVRQSAVRRWLDWLISHNDLYVGVTIDATALSVLPEGSVPDDIRRIFDNPAAGAVDDREGSGPLQENDDNVRVTVGATAADTLDADAGSGPAAVDEELPENEFYGHSFVPLPPRTSATREEELNAVFGAGSYDAPANPTVPPKQAQAPPYSDSTTDAMQASIDRFNSNPSAGPIRATAANTVETRWPQLLDVCNELTASGYLAMSFPTLFPLGSPGDPTVTGRKSEVSLREYLKHLLRFSLKDDASATGKIKHPFDEHRRFKFWAHNLLSRQTILEGITANTFTTTTSTTTTTTTITTTTTTTTTTLVKKP